MHQVIWQEEHKIEISLYGEVSTDDMRQVVHQLESLSAMFPNIFVLIDAAGAEKYDFRVALDQFDFYKRYKHNLRRVAIVSDSKFSSFLLQQFNKFSDTEFKSFNADEIEAARKWIFPSRLP